MSDDKVDPNKSPTEVPAKESKTELTEEELSKVSGGSKSWGITVGTMATEGQP